MNYLDIYDEAIRRFTEDFCEIAIRNDRRMINDFPVVCERLFSSSLLAQEFINEVEENV